MSPRAAACLLAALTGCASAGQVQEACSAVTAGSLAVQPGALSGGYRITVVATSPAARRSTGSLALGTTDRSVANASTARQVLEGAMQVALDSLGAVAPAGVSLRDARIVGISSGSSLMMRLEAAAPAAGQAIEGSFVSLTVHRASASGFAGDWRSGDGRREVARGYFCAVRTAA